MNKVYHTSPVEIKEINKNGLFDDCLFFSDDIYAMGDIVKTYSMEVECIEANRFFYQDNCDEILKDVIEDIMNYFDCDKDTAIDLLDNTEDSFQYAYNKGLDGGEYSWYIQKKQGEAGKMLGYDGSISDDEQGRVYIVPMFGREKDLKKVR